MGSPARSLLLLLAAVWGATADWILHTPGGGPIDSSCPCMPAASCPRRFGESPQDLQMFGHLPVCADYRLVRCCGVSFSVVTSDHRVPDQRVDPIRLAPTSVRSPVLNNGKNYQMPWNTNGQYVQPWRPESPPYPPAIAVQPYEADFKSMLSGAMFVDVTGSTSSNNEHVTVSSIESESKRLHSLEEQLFLLRPIAPPSESPNDRAMFGGNLEQFTLPEGNSESGTVKSVEKQSQRLHHRPAIQPLGDLHNKAVDGGDFKQFISSEGSATDQPQATADLSSTPIAKNTTSTENGKTTFTVESDSVQSMHTTSGDPVDGETEAESQRKILPESVNEQSSQITNGYLDVKDPETGAGLIDTENVAITDNETETALRDINMSLTDISSVLSTEINELERESSFPGNQSSENVFDNETSKTQEIDNEKQFLSTETTATDESPQVETDNIQKDALEAAAEPCAADSTTRTEETLSSNNSASRSNISKCFSIPIEASDLNTSLDADSPVSNHTSGDTEILVEEDYAISDDTVSENSQGGDNDFDGSEIVEYSAYPGSPEPRMISSGGNVDASKAITDGGIISITETIDPTLLGTTAEAILTKELSCQELIRAMRRENNLDGLLMYSDESEIDSTTSVPEGASSTKETVLIVYPENSRRGREGRSRSAVTVVYPMNSPCGTASGELTDWFASLGYEVNNRLEDLEGVATEADDETVKEQLESTTHGWPDSLLGDVSLAITEQTTTTERSGHNSGVSGQDLRRDSLRDDTGEQSVRQDEMKVVRKNGSLTFHHIGRDQVQPKKVKQMVSETNSPIMPLSSTYESHQNLRKPDDVLPDDRQQLGQKNTTHPQPSEEIVRPPTSSSSTLHRPPTLQELLSRKRRPDRNAEVETDAVSSSTTETEGNYLSTAEKKASARSVTAENPLMSTDRADEMETSYINLHPSLRNRFVKLHTAENSEEVSNGAHTAVTKAAGKGRGYIAHLTDTPTEAIDAEVSVSTEQERRKQRNRMAPRLHPSLLANVGRGNLRRPSGEHNGSLQASARANRSKTISNHSRYTNDTLQAILRKLWKKPTADQGSLEASSAVNDQDDELPDTRTVVQMNRVKGLTNKMNKRIESISSGKGDNDNSETLDIKQEKVRANQFSNKVVIRRLPYAVLRYSSKNDTSSVIKLASNDTAETKESESISSGDGIAMPAEVETSTTSSEDTETAEVETHTEIIPTRQGRLPTRNAKKTTQRGRILKAAEAGRGNVASTRNVTLELKEKGQPDQTLNVDNSNGLDMTTLPGESATRVKLRINSGYPILQRSHGLERLNRLRFLNRNNTGTTTNVTEPAVDKLAVTSPQPDVRSETSSLNDEHTTKDIASLEQAIFQEDSSGMSNLRNQRAAFKPPKHMEGGFVPMINTERPRRVTPESEEAATFKFPVPTKIAAGVLRKPHQSEKQPTQTRRPLPVSTPQSPQAPRKHPLVPSAQRPSLPPSMSNQNSQPSQKPSAPQRPSLPLSTSNQNPQTPQQSLAPQRLTLPLSASNQIPQISQKSTAHRPTLPFPVLNQNPPPPQQPSAPQRLTLPFSTSNQISQTTQEPSTAHRPTLPFSVFNQNPQTPQVPLSRPTSPLFATNQNPQSLHVVRHPEVDTWAVQPALIRQPMTVANQFSHHTPHHSAQTGVSGNSVHGALRHPGNDQPSPTNVLGSSQLNPILPQNLHNMDVIQQQVLPPNTIRAPTQPAFIDSNTGHSIHFNNPLFHQHNPVFPQGILNTHASQISQSFAEIPFNSHHRPTQPTNTHPDSNEIRHISNQVFPQPERGFLPNVHHAETAHQQPAVGDFPIHRNQASHLAIAHSIVSHFNDVNVQNKFQQPQQSHAISHNLLQTMINNGKPTLEELADYFPEVFYQQVPRSRSSTTTGDEVSVRHQARPVKQKTQGPGSDGLRQQDISPSSEALLRTSKHKSKPQTTTDDLHQQFKAQQFIQGLLEQHQKEQARSTPSPSFATSDLETKPLLGMRAQQTQDPADNELELPSNISSSDYQQQLQLYHKQQLAYLQHLRQMLASDNTDGDTT